MQLARQIEYAYGTQDFSYLMSSDAALSGEERSHILSYKHVLHRFSCDPPYFRYVKDHAPSFIKDTINFYILRGPFELKLVLNMFLPEYFLKVRRHQHPHPHPHHY